MSLIEKNDALVSEAERLGLELRRKNEPDASTLFGRYSYNAETGVITGPTGKPLKSSENRGVWRVGLWSKENKNSVPVMVGRLAFAIQHGRWPVGLSYRDRDTTNHCAANLKETYSKALQTARAIAADPVSFQRSLVRSALPDGFPDWETFEALQDPSNLVGAYYRGRFIPDEINKIDDVLRHGTLTDRQRIVLENKLILFRYSWVKAINAANAVRVFAGWPCAGNWLPEKPKETTGARVGPKGPTRAQNKAAGVSRSRTGTSLLSLCLKKPGGARRSVAGKKRGR